ncbi:E3 ubiquitin-protein ligase At1g12760-like isoform X1 [Magnolia sinica]|uniref:E3 ubiquitin-protein ligase At1g12760-like isoform X1 n=1 Tax=Magnolia sinica TaxID=86752 RepID=UPI00265A0D93|nr:E3 ubiquitin-protein ligase At1g12760-like isoform X1 [Magnolia sinica]
MEGENAAVQVAMDRTPFLHSSTNPTTTTSFLSRRILRESPMLIRGTAALQLEEQQAEWGYSKPVVFLDIVWNVAFVLVSSVVVGSTFKERPAMPLRMWLGGYTLQCVLHVGFVFSEYRRRMWARQLGEDGTEGRSSVVRRFESINTMVSFLWWIVGFYWIITGGQALLQDAPRLYWLTVVFLAFDVFFAIFCVTLACIIGIALCCCLPCIIGILYAMAGQEGASDAEISILPRFRFRPVVDQREKFGLEQQQAVVVTIMESSTREGLGELSVSPEDSECCICLSQYEEGAELRSLPCNHHFHSDCIVKWLRINATCPLCKYNIIRGNELV